MAVAMAAMIFRIIDAVCFPLSLIGFVFLVLVFGLVLGEDWESWEDWEGWDCERDWELLG